MAASSHENQNPNMDQNEGEGDSFDDIFDSYREKRFAEMKHAAKQQEELKSKSHGVYTILENEKELVNAMKASKKVICHFGIPSFRRCGLLDAHFRTLAAKHFGTRFVFVNVEKAPFMVTKLNVRILQRNCFPNTWQIKVLPFVAVFVDSAVVDHLLGFEDLGNNDNFTTATLERRLSKSGVILDDKTKSLVQGEKNKARTIKQGNVTGANDSEGEEEDDD